MQNAKGRRIKSISSDIVFAVTSGKSKLSKQLQLGIAIKNLTGSRKVIDVLNHLGLTVYYHTIEVVETELTFSQDDALYTPHGMKLLPELETGIAYDNYDRFVETLSGKNTLHDTVGIAYQVVREQDFNIETLQENFATTVTQNQAKNNGNQVKRKRRKYEATCAEIEPYMKKTKMTAALLPIGDPRYPIYVPHSLNEAKLYDLFWMLNLYCDPINTPM